MRSAALISYDIRRIEKNLDAGIARPADSDRLPKLRLQLVTATRRELKALAKVLTYKADIYAPIGRIYSHEGKWTVVPFKGDENNLVLCFTKYNGIQLFLRPDDLTDGHGRSIE